MKNLKDAILGKSTVSRITMGLFLVLLILVLLSTFGCSDPYPIKGNDGGEYRLIQEAVDNPSDGELGRIAAYERKGDDTRWIKTGEGHFVDTHRAL